MAWQFDAPRRGRDRSGRTAPISAELEAETQRLLAGRTRDIAFSDAMQRHYWKSSWPQRSKIARASMIWILLINAVIWPFSCLMIASDLWTHAYLGLVLLPLAHILGYLLWLRPRAAWIEGLSLLASVNIVMIVYGTIGQSNGGFFAERYATGALFATAVGLIIFEIGTVWTILTAVTSLLVFAGFMLVNPASRTIDVAATVVYYTMNFISVIAARQSANLLARRTFLMALRDRCRGAELTRANQQLEILATKDPLTGLSNRRSAADQIAKVWSDQDVSKAGVACVMVDIDHFKKLNDALGHAAGDECLRRVAASIEGSVRSGLDIVCRYGGEEFLIVLTGATQETASKMAERIRAGVEALGIVNPALGAVDGAPAVVTVSVGVACASALSRPELVVKRADDALYEAKHGGRNRVSMAPAQGCDLAAATLVPADGQRDAAIPEAIAMSAAR